jgi:hypothetical protein
LQQVKPSLVLIGLFRLTSLALYKRQAVEVDGV